MGNIGYFPLENMLWSYSRISSYDDCPYKFYLKYIFGAEDNELFYSSYGKFMHKLLEWFYKGEITKNEMRTRFLCGFSREIGGEYPKENIVTGYIKKGSDYFKTFKPFEYKTVAVEDFLTFDISGYHFNGYVDYIGEDKDGNLVIVDHKSRDLKQRSKRKKPTLKDQELDDMLRQLYIYAAAVEQRYGRLPTTLCFNCFKNGELIKEAFDNDSYKKAIDWAVNTIESIKEEQSWKPNIEYFSCRFLCGVHDDCVYYEDMQDDMRRGRK